MSKSAHRAYTYRHKIPTKREYGRTLDERRFPCLLQETGRQEELQVATRLYALSYLHARQVYLWGDKRGLVQQIS